MKTISQDLSTFEDHVNNRLGNVRNFGYFRQQIQSIVNDLGFTHFDYSLLSKNNNFEFLMTALPDAFINTYHHEKLYKYDMFLDYTKNSKQGVYQSTINNLIDQMPDNAEYTIKNKMIRELAYDYRFFDGYCISVDTEYNGKVMFSVLSDQENPEKFKHSTMERRGNLMYLANTIYMISLKKFPKELPYKPPLDDKTILVIEHLAYHAATTAEVAEQLFMSVGTVNRHINQAKEILGACSTTNAAIIARDLGLISSIKSK